jgi:uroporphyrin-III C-methyltransferase/precorrin-2 dehydrogenase/sirohydrochlorin ferrochelatase
MPLRTLGALADKAIAEGLDPRTRAIAVARATYPDQVVIAAGFGELPAHLEAADLVGPVLIIMGSVCGEYKIASDFFDNRRLIAAH